MPGQSHSGPLPQLLGDALEIRDRLRSHVEVLAGKIGERSLFQHESLKTSALYIEDVLRTQGHTAASQWFEVENMQVRNVEVEIAGTSNPEELVVAGAHYDSVVGSPGANDNASGVAALLELARLLSGKKLGRTVRLIAFANEEPPFFRTGFMGSRISAHRSRTLRENITAMLSIETIGYYSDRRGSQRYPAPFGLFYPSTGNFIGVVGNIASAHLVRKCIASFLRHAAFPSEGLAAPGWIVGLGWSDHWAYWREGYPAVMITDTALFRYPQYHTAEDTPEKLDYVSMARVVAGVAEMIVDLASS